MAQSKSVYLRQKTLLKVLKNVDFTVTNLWLGLTVAGVEVTGNGYARIPLTNTNWSDPADDGSGNYQECHQTVDLLFAPASGGAWGLCDGFVLCDALVNGNTVYKDVLTASKQIDDADQMKIPANTLIVKEG